MDEGYDAADSGEMFHASSVLPNERVLDNGEFGEVIMTSSRPKCRKD